MNERTSTVASDDPPLDGIIQVLRGINRRTLLAVLALAVLVVPFTFTRMADAHSSSWCEHWNKADSTHDIIYLGHEWNGSRHGHSYRHVWLTGTYDHNTFKDCTLVH